MLQPAAAAAAGDNSSVSARVMFDGDVMRSEEDASTRLRHMNRTHDQRHQHHSRFYIILLVTRLQAVSLFCHHSRFSFTRQCQQVVSADGGTRRYLATHRHVGVQTSHSKFVCLEFVWRTNAVVQVG